MGFFHWPDPDHMGTYWKLTIVLFVLAWVGLHYWGAGHDGWREWARHYRLDQPFDVKWLRVVDGHGYTAHPNGQETDSITLGVSPQGLAVRIDLPFRLFHPTLFIPWSDIEDFWHQETHFGIDMRDLRLRFRAAPDEFLSIDPAIRDTLAHEAGGAWRPKTGGGEPKR